MHRIIALLSSLLLGLFVLAIVFAQEPTPQPDNLVTPQPPPRSVYELPYLLEEIEAPFDITTGGGETCALAANMSFPTFGGTTTDVQDYPESDLDPPLSCMWGNPSRPNGYRTVWYKLTALYDAVLTLDTVTSNYDTVIGVFQPTDDVNVCSTLDVQVACNDDYTGFSSRATFTAAAGEIYYIVIADWSGPAAGQLTLNGVLEEQPFNSNWVQILPNNNASARTHHETVAVGPYIYTLGGQETEDNSSERINRLSRYYPASNSWAELNQMPGVGFTYLTAVHINNRIYVPGGDDGTPGVFNGTHYVYDIGSSSWLPQPAASPPVAVGWSQAVVNGSGNGYYLLGGLSSKPAFTDTAQVHNEVWFYDVAANAWLDSLPMSTPRYGHTAVRLGNRICVVGGLNGLSLLGSGECLQEFVGWSPIASLNIPRYGAGSVVGSDGKWYVFGGISVDSAGNLYPVGRVEVYDPANPGSGWSVMGVPYNLVEPNSPFARAWARGERIGNYIYAIGGNHYAPAASPPADYMAVEVVQRLYTPPLQNFIPAVFNFGSNAPDDNMASAKALPLNFWVNGNFQVSTDFYDFYTFNLNSSGQVSIGLNSIPGGSDYNLFLFDDNKLVWGSSMNGGNLDENITLTLSTGRYYVLVQRIYGSSGGSNYWLAVLR